MNGNHILNGSESKGEQRVEQVMKERKRKRKYFLVVLESKEFFNGEITSHVYSKWQTSVSS